MKKLKEASCAGVQVRMIVRGICCLLPELPGKTENIHITSIVGRFLEHSRIYCFGQGSQERMYIASADFMTRNTERRVEVACPIYDLSVRRKIHQILDACLKDTLKARQMRSDGSYCRRPRSPPLTASSSCWSRPSGTQRRNSVSPTCPRSPAVSSTGSAAPSAWARNSKSRIPAKGPGAEAPGPFFPKNMIIFSRSRHTKPGGRSV